MKQLRLAKVFLLLASIALSAQLISAQTPNNDSSVKIEIKNYKYVVSGAVSSETVKSEVVGKIKEMSRNNADFSGLKVDTNFRVFTAGWQKSFDKALFKSKLWKSGVFIFTANRTADEYPNLPDEILNAEIFLIGHKKPIKISDYRDKTVVLFFLAHWCGPCRIQANTLNKFYSEISANNIEIIGINVDTTEERNFKEFVRQLNLKYKMGTAGEGLYESALRISKFHAIPQVFVIRNGKLHGIYMGGSTTTIRQMEAKILEISKMR